MICFSYHNNTTTKHTEATMNDKIKELLSTAYKTDSIEKNKWRIENREQLREQRKKELKELMEKDKEMSNNKQSSVDWLLSNISSKIDNEYWCNQKEITEFVEQAKEMELIGKETSYADGYKEGYNRALEMVEWYIKHHIRGIEQQ